MSESVSSDHPDKNSAGDDQAINEDRFDKLFADLESKGKPTSVNSDSIVESDFVRILGVNTIESKNPTFYDYFMDQYEQWKDFISIYDRLTIAMTMLGIVTIIIFVFLIGYVVHNNHSKDDALNEELNANQPTLAASNNSKQAPASSILPPETNATSMLSPPPPPKVAQPAAPPPPPPAPLNTDAGLIVQPAPASEDILEKLLKLENADSTPDNNVMQALQNDPNKRDVTCMLEYNHVIITNKPCAFSKTGTGDFMMTDTTQFRVIVTGTGRLRQVYWDNMMKGKEFKERGSISPDPYDKACWSNEAVRICAWR